MSGPYKTLRDFERRFTAEAGYRQGCASIRSEFLEKLRPTVPNRNDREKDEIRMAINSMITEELTRNRARAQRRHHRG